MPYTLDNIEGPLAKTQLEGFLNDLDINKIDKNGGTFTGDIIVPAESYGVGWNGSNEVPTKNDIYDKIQTLGGGGGVNSVVAGTNISVDNTDPDNPIINSLADRYKTTSATSQTIVSSGSLTFTVGSNLAYTSQQDVIIVYDASNHMHGTVTSYSGTTLVVDIQHKTGSGTYASWTINLDAIETTPVTVTDSTTINLSITSQEITAEVINGSIDTTKLSTDVNTSLGKADTAVQPSGLTNYFNKSTDDTDDVTEGTVNKFSTTAEKTKLGFISVTQNVDLDQIETDTATNNAKISNATHTGDVTGATALTIANNVVTNAKLGDMAVNTLKGRITAGTGDPEDLTASQVRTITETETTTQLNTRDTNNRNRANHTGTQLSSTISDLEETVEDFIGGALLDSTSIDLIYDDAGGTISAQREALTGAITASKNSNTTSLGSFTTAQLNTAISDNDIATGGGTATGTNTGDQTITLTSEATGSGTGSFSVTLLDSAVIGKVLTGFTVAGSRTAIIATDTILIAFGKVQKYLNDLSALAFSGNASDLSGTKTSTFISDFSTAVASLITGKQNTITLTTTGTSGPATLIGDTLNIPQYSGGGGGSYDYGLSNAIASGIF